MNELILHSFRGDWRVPAQDAEPGSVQGLSSGPITGGRSAMYYVLLIFGVIAAAAGVFVIAFGVPMRETPFGAALLIAGSVAVTGGFIVVGLAAALQELQRVVQGLKARPVPRPLRPMERKEGERKDGTERRPGPPRIPMPARQPSPEAPNLIPTNLDAPLEVQPQAPTRKPGPDWLRRAVAEIESAPRFSEAAPDEADTYRTDEVRQPLPDVWPRANPAPEHALPEARQALAAAPPNIFDMVWPSDRRRPETAPEKRFESPIDPPMRPLETRPPPMAPMAPMAPAPLPVPAPAPPARAEPRPLSILKSGVIDEMAYTLFTDGSIEAQMPDGTMRFGSIDELRQHLEKHES
jgi:hypothetical protein